MKEEPSGIYMWISKSKNVKILLSRNDPDYLTFDYWKTKIIIFSAGFVAWLLLKLCGLA